MVDSDEDVHTDGGTEGVDVCGSGPGARPDQVVPLDPATGRPTTAPDGPPDRPPDRPQHDDEQHARLDALLVERARSRFLAAASRRLGLSLHPGRTARTVVELAVAELADSAVVVWPGAGVDGVVEWIGREHDGGERSGQAVTASLPAPVLDALRDQETDPRPLIFDDLAGVPGLDIVGDVAGLDVAGIAAAVVTLPGNGLPAGALVLLRHPAGARAEAAATDGDAAVVEEFAQRAGIALTAAGLYAQQVRTTSLLRSSLAQPPLPSVSGMTFGAAYRPSDEGLLIGGDFYDVMPGLTGPTTFLLGDVCGKGVEAAVGTGQLRQSVLALRRLVHDPVRLLELLNATMLETMPPAGAPRFVTLVLGAAVPRPDGGLSLRLAGGGHLPPLVVRRGGRVEQVEVGGMLVGAVPDARFASVAVDLAPGESCVLYSDGVTEAHGGVDGRQAFGEDRLAEVLRGCDVLPAPGIADRVALHATNWLATGYHDDIAALVVQAPLPVRRPPARHLRSVHRDSVPSLVAPPVTAPVPTAPVPTGPFLTAQPRTGPPRIRHPASVPHLDPLPDPLPDALPDAVHPDPAEPDTPLGDLSRSFPPDRPRKESP